MTSDLVLLDEALDAAHVVDDYVRGVVGLADGRWGGVDDRTSSWSQRLFGKPAWTKEHQLARMMGGIYGPEQLRKAANAATELSTAVAALAGAESPLVLAVHSEVVDAGLGSLPATLRDPDVTGSSLRLREAHRTLSRSIGRMSEARTKLVLAQMRGSQPGPTVE